MKIRELMGRSPVISILTIFRPADAGALAQALVRGGLPVMEVEVTARTPGALEAIGLMRRAAPEAVIGASALTRAEDLAAAEQAGAQFGVTPGLTPELIAAAREVRLPLLPGVMTPAELIIARTAGYDTCKLFPSQQAGGTDMLKALSEPFPDVMFCPAGGITRHNAHDYLALSNVLCVAGSWIAPRDAVAACDWITIEALARDASALRRTSH